MADDDNDTIDETVDEQQVEAAEPERPEWLGDFESPEEMRRSFDEAQRLIQERGQERNELRAEVDELRAYVESLPQQQPQNGDFADNPLVAQYTRAFEEGDVQTMLAVQAQIAQAAATQQMPAPPEQDYTLLAAFAENQVRATNPDYDSYRTKTVEILQRNPQLIPDGATLDGVQNGILMALNAARGEVAYEASRTQAERDAEAERAREAKRQAQTVPGGGSRPQRMDDSSDLFEKIKAAGQGGFRLP